MMKESCTKVCIEKTLSEKNKNDVHLFSPLLVVTTTLLLAWCLDWVSGLSADMSSAR